MKKTARKIKSTYVTSPAFIFLMIGAPLYTMATKPDTSAPPKVQEKTVNYADKVNLSSTLIKERKPDNSPLKIISERYKFFIMGEDRYLRCRFKLLTNSYEKMALYYVIVARNFDNPVKVEQVIPREVILNEHGEPSHVWGYEIEAENGMMIENLIPRSIPGIDYNHLKYYFWDKDGTLLLFHEVKLH